jgi:SAM-dependent methyltransferase
MPIPTNVITLPENMSALPWTGERFIPGVTGQVEMEHIHRYIAAMQLCKGKDVLDIASGEGYGCYILSQVANSVVGVDIDPLSVQVSNDKYGSNSIRFKEGSCAAIPLEDNSVDIVISFETIEHIKEQELFVKEIKRVLRKDGICIISTPDRVAATPLGSEPNPYHIRELYREEFYRILNKYFENVTFFGQRSITGSLIFPDGRSVYDKPSEELFFATGDTQRTIDCVEFFPRPQNIIAIATNIPTINFAASVYEGIFGTLDALNAAYDHLVRQNEESLKQRDEISKQQDEIAMQHESLSRQYAALLEKYESLTEQHSLLVERYMEGSNL